MTTDPKFSTDKLPIPPTGLLGRFFHTIDEDGNIKWQGVVVSEVSATHYIVELFEWITGESNNQRLVTIDEMCGWNFYDNPTWMNNYYKNHPYRENKNT